MLKRLGIETDHFGTSNGTLPGLSRRECLPPSRVILEANVNKPW
jgi:hypothetical protein